MIEALAISTIGSLIAAALGIGLGYFFRGEQFRKKVDSAIEEYVCELEKLISRAMGDGPRKANVNARAIVATRDDLRGHMIALSDLLDSEIDKLSIQIDMGPGKHVGSDWRNSLSGAQYSDDKIYETIEVLWKKWPAKKKQIRIELRKLIDELGLYRL